MTKLTFLPNSVAPDAKPPKDSSHRLVIIIPGVASPSSAWGSLRKRLEEEEGYKPNQTQWFTFDYGNQALKSLMLLMPGRIDKLAHDLCSHIEGEWARNGSFKDVVLIGHSLGGLIVRKVYLLSVGAVSNQPGSKKWGAKVSRIILFASPNRGMKRTWKWWVKPLSHLLHFLPLPHLLYEDALQGSNFITNLRIDWIRYFSSFDLLQDNTTPNTLQVPRIVQFLGSNDEIVDDEDSKDFWSTPNSYDQEIADATHATVYRLDTPDADDGRYALLREAFIEDSPRFLNPAPVSKHSTVKRIVFLLHGIRASNVDEWVRQLSTEIEEHAPETRYIPLEYGYFRALQFAFPGSRKKNIRIFQDYYTEYFAQHPEAKFNIIAHSNGTYMLGYSLKKTSGMRFENVVLAGCALPVSYPWSKLKGKQVGRVMNERANQDWPIALLCKALVSIGQKDIGSSGFDGFYGGEVFEVAYHQGDHGAALSKENCPRLVDFIFDGKQTLPTNLCDAGRYRLWSNLMPYVTWILLICLFIVFLVGWIKIGLVVPIITLGLFLVLYIILMAI